MHQKRTAWEQHIPAPEIPSGENGACALVAFVYSLSKEFGCDPQAYLLGQEDTLWLYYGGSCFDCGAIWDEYALSMALAEQTFACSLYGTSERGEPVQLSAQLEREKDQICLQKQNISGKNFHRIRDLCVKIEVKEPQARQSLHDLFTHMSFRYGFAAVRRTPFVQAQLGGFLEPDAGTYYAYLRMEEDAAGGFLDALSVAQKQQLWLLFLQDGFSAVEFECVLQQMGSRCPPPLFTWELSLRLALGEAGIAVHNDPDGFWVTDGTGRRRSFDYEAGVPAERLFLKLLFPVPPGREPV